MGGDAFRRQPEEPAVPQFRTMDEDAAGTHELFESYLRAGFSRAEAMELVKTIVATNLAASHEADRRSK